MLAELCGRCAGQADLLLDSYGGQGRSAIKLARDLRVLRPSTAWVRTVGGIVGRSALYLLVAVAVFVAVTLISARN